jgi:acetyl-CoA C-acetyltransferase
MGEAVVVSAARSPIGRPGNGSLADVPPDDLAALVIRAALDKIPQLEERDASHLYLGCDTVSHEPGGNIARRAAIQLGPEKAPATTVNRNCASPPYSADAACRAIEPRGDRVFVIADACRASRGRPRPVTGGGLSPAFLSEHLHARAHKRSGPCSRWMGQYPLPDTHTSTRHLAERLATSLKISRYEQDEFGVRSHLLAEQAIEDGFYAKEIVPVTRRDGSVIAADDMPRPGVTYTSVSRFTPWLQPRGTVTPGNSAPPGDGAAAVITMGDARARELGINPLARIVAARVTQPVQQAVGLGAAEAARRALTDAGMVIGDMDLIEINEAFAVQVIASYRALKIDPGKLNVHGGAIALGHPSGMTGPRIMTTLLNGLQSEDAHLGLATLCTGSGQGMAIILERLS